MKVDFITNGKPKSRFGGLWRHPDFMKLWAGQTISELGSRITRDGVPYTAVIVLNAPASQMGFLTAVGAASVLLFGLLAGVWVDRFRRRPIMIAADLARAVILASIPIAAYAHRLSMAQLYVVIALAGFCTVFFDVAYQSYLPSLVERENLLEGNSKLAMSASAAEIAGPSLTGILVQLITAPIAILFDAISFLISAASVILIRKPEPAASSIHHHTASHRGFAFCLQPSAAEAAGLLLDDCVFVPRASGTALRPLRNPRASHHSSGARGRDSHGRRGKSSRRHSCPSHRTPFRPRPHIYRIGPHHGRSLRPDPVSPRRASNAVCYS